jgi:FkbM family methyltransferase
MSPERKGSVFRRVWKPWFVYRPSQLARRLAVAVFQPRPGYRPLQVAWGATVEADPSKVIGRAIVTTGVYDLAVTEVIARLARLGDTVIDAGANVGYMTVLAGIAVGPAGRVIGYEPHPELFEVYRRNVEACRASLPFANAQIHNAALGAMEGQVPLVSGEGYNSNDGVSRVGLPSDTETGLTVEMTTLDAALGDRAAGVLKLDVEGYEPEVLRGTTRALVERRIRHVLFEDHHPPGKSETVALLKGAGYRLYSIGWAMRGPILAQIEEGRLAYSYEAPSYLATLAPDEAVDRCSTRGWLAFRHRLGR